MPPIQVPATLTWNSATVAELAAHDLTVADALDAFEGDAEFFAQPPAAEIFPRGMFQVRPQRLRMVGPTATGQLLTIILELPDDRLASHIVTGWETDAREAERYYAGA